MKYVPALGATVLLVIGSVQGCSSDETAPAAAPTPDGSAGSSGAGGRSSGGGGGTGGASTGGVSTGGAGGARSPEPTGSACDTAADCFFGFEAGALSGAIECITKVQDGYCTHRCDTDADCCAVPGECRTDLKQVCSPFENTGYKVCFLACGPGDIRLPGDAGVTLPDGAPAFVDGDDFCKQEANPAFVCRSSGGGNQNRKVCVPGGGGDGGLPPDGGGPPPGTGGRPGRDGGQPPGTGGRPGRDGGGSQPDSSTGDASGDGSAPMDASNDGG
jgi:hypothetical protein